MNNDFINEEHSSDSEKELNEKNKLIMKTPPIYKYKSYLFGYYPISNIDLKEDVLIRRVWYTIFFFIGFLSLFFFGLFLWLIGLIIKNETLKLYSIQVPLISNITCLFFVNIYWYI